MVHLSLNVLVALTKITVLLDCPQCVIFNGAYSDFQYCSTSRLLSFTPFVLSCIHIIKYVDVSAIVSLLHKHDLRHGLVMEDFVP